MNIAIIDASGFVGLNLLEEALDRNHNVTAIVRNPEKSKTGHPNLVVKKGDVLNMNEIAKLMEGSKAIEEAVKKQGLSA